MRKGDLVFEEDIIDFFGLYVSDDCLSYGYTYLSHALEVRDLGAGGLIPKIILCPVELI